MAKSVAIGWKKVWQSKKGGFLLKLTKKPNKPWKDRKKKQILEGRLIDTQDAAEELEEEIIRWNKKREETK